jgi:hypothetical protein
LGAAGGGGFPPQAAIARIEIKIVVCFIRFLLRCTLS